MSKAKGKYCPNCGHFNEVTAERCANACGAEFTVRNGKAVSPPAEMYDGDKKGAPKVAPLLPGQEDVDEDEDEIIPEPEGDPDPDVEPEQEEVVEEDTVVEETTEPEKEDPPATGMLKCDVCGKECKGETGLRAHKRSHK